MTANPSTRDWVQRAQKGDRLAMDELVLSYREELDRFISSRLGQGLRAKVEVSDLAQETFLKAFHSLPSFKWQGERAFFSWLCGIASNLILNLGRTHSRAEPIRIDGDALAADGAPPSKHLRREERFERLEDALESLSPEHRQVILLTRIEGLPVDEVARRLERSPKATRQLIWRALKSLRERFGDTESLSLPARKFAEGDPDGE